MRRLLLPAFVACILAAMPGDCLWARQPAGDDFDEALQKTLAAAVARVAPSVVQIETSGGTDIVGSGQGQIRKGTGPTTGLVVSADGYIISSAFNFANKPSAIFVAIPGQPDRLIARVVATDHTRMLTLLKVDAAKLPVPVAAAKKSIRVGQWSIALGRTWSSTQSSPTISVGIISALGRVWGKAIQTDAKVSPVNYGGPLIDLEGRVLGVLVPASPRGQDETAGAEWYDSGIGFAIPAEDLNAVLPRLKEGKDLHKGVLGITLQNSDVYGAAPVVAGTAPDSAAVRAGIQAGDIITEINGIPISRQAQMLHVLGNKYEGDTVSLKLRRGKEEVRIASVKLGAEARALVQPFLGILPMRDDPDPGEQVRYVFPKSPAEAAGLKAGDRLLRIGLGESPLRPFFGRDSFTALLARFTPGMEIKLEVARKESKKTETVKVKLGLPTDTVPDSLPQPSSLEKALQTQALPPEIPIPETDRGPAKKKEGRKPKEPAAKSEDTKATSKKKTDTGLLKRTTPTGENQYWLYVPENYNPNIAHALVIWLQPAGSRKDKDHETEQVIDGWKESCASAHIILLCPKAESDSGWLASEADFVLQTIRDCLSEYTIDQRRIVVHGLGIGGQMAYYLGFNARELIRGVAVIGAPVDSQPKESQAGEPLAFFLVAGKGDPSSAAMSESKKRLTEAKYSVVYREPAEAARPYLDAAMLQELVRWIDSLDRQ